MLLFYSLARCTAFVFFFYVHEDDFVFIFETEKLRQKVDGKNVMMPLVDNLKNQNRC